MENIPKKHWEIWRKLQENGAIAYRLAPEVSCAIAGRTDVDVWKQFMNLRVGGRVLDIGCGPQGMPSYLTGWAGAQIIGIDPLLPMRRAPSDMSFLKAIGECLPFKSHTFDSITIATSLDHALSPLLVLQEARRCLQKSGSLLIWQDFGIGLGARLAHRIFRFLQHCRALIAPAATEPQPFWAWLNSTLEKPQGATDLYHFKHLSESKLQSWYSQTGFRVKRKAVFGTSVFFELCIGGKMQGPVMNSTADGRCRLLRK